ncbi:MAG: hypothetical protein ACFWTN_07380 [Clostridium sp.]
MKQKYGHRSWIIGILIFIGIGVIFPVIINEAYKLNVGYRTLWTASDTLLYYGSFLSAAGTIILGIVAWRQNKRLLHIEEISFISKNSCIGFVNKVEINDLNRKVCSLNLHTEQIVSALENINNLQDYSSYCINIYIHMKENFPVLVRVNHVVFALSDGKKTKPEQKDFQNFDKRYSRTAIYSEGILFSITMLVSPKEKQELLTFLKDKGNQLFLDIDFTLLTDKFVSSHLKCRSTLSCTKDLKYENIQVDENNPPICFWYGNRVLEKDEVEIKDLK